MSIRDYSNCTDVKRGYFTGYEWWSFLYHNKPYPNEAHKVVEHIKRK